MQWSPRCKRMLKKLLVHLKLSATAGCGSQLRGEGGVTSWRWAHSRCLASISVTGTSRHLSLVGQRLRATLSPWATAWQINRVDIEATPSSQWIEWVYFHIRSPALKTTCCRHSCSQWMLQEYDVAVDFDLRLRSMNAYMYFRICASLAAGARYYSNKASGRG